MGTYIYFIVVLFIIFVHVSIDVEQLRKEKSIDKNKNLRIFFISAVLSIAILFNGDIDISKWVLFCSTTIILFREGFYGFIFQVFMDNDSGKYKIIPSWYDNLLYKLHISEIDSRIVFATLSVLWMIFHKKIIGI